MYSRVTQLEIDTVRLTTDDAVDLFAREVVPGLREQPGYQGALVLSTPEGRGILMSFWETEDQAAAGEESTVYSQTLAEYMTLFRAPPGRERYAVAYSDLPSLTAH